MGNTTATLYFESTKFFLNTNDGDLKVTVSTGAGPYEHDERKQTYIFLMQRGVSDPLAVVPLKGSSRPQRRDIYFSRSLLVKGSFYYCVWSTCCCNIGKKIAQTEADVEADEEYPMPGPWYLLNEDEKGVFRSTFARIDRNGDGHITHKELHDYYQKTIHDDLTSEEVRAMMTEADVDHSGEIELGEFFTITMRAKNHGTSLKWKKLENLFASELQAVKKQRI